MREWLGKRGVSLLVFRRVGLALLVNLIVELKELTQRDRQWIEALSEERVSCLVLRTKSLRLLWFAVLDEMILSTY